jgi:hypothetical protein
MEAYENITQQLEELEDIEAYIKVKSSKQESFPLSIVEKLILGEESKIKIFREYRGQNVTSLSKMLNISEAYLSQIENHKRKGNIELYKKIATTLEIDLELLI